MAPFPSCLWLFKGRNCSEWSLTQIIPEYPNTSPQQPLLLIICTANSPHHSLGGEKGGSSVCNRSLLWITGSNLALWKQTAVPNSSYNGLSSSSPTSASEIACRAAHIPSVDVGSPSDSRQYTAGLHSLWADKLPWIIYCPGWILLSSRMSKGLSVQVPTPAVSITGSSRQGCEGLERHLVHSTCSKAGVLIPHAFVRAV